jgi:hypothetical protein
LKSLQSDTNGHPVRHCWGTEQLNPGNLSITLFFFILLLDLVKLDVEGAMIQRDAVNLSQCIHSFIHLSMAVVVAGTLREEGHTTTENNGPKVCDAHWNTP